MIKLIASDLDGTLLLPDGSLPSETFDLIERLYQKGILFCVASGRQYAGLTQLFAPVADKALFIAENGALVYYRGERLYEDGIPASAIPSILSAVRKIPDAYPLLCRADCAYAESGFSLFTDECAKYYPRFRQVEKLEDVPISEPVCKVAIFDPLGSSRSGNLLAKSLPSFRVILSGKVWSDISMPGTNKGKAFQFIQRRLSLSPDECMAFGDYMNDLELLLACNNAYVTENGFPPLKERIGRTVPSNAEEGVIRKMKELLGE